MFFDFFIVGISSLSLIAYLIGMNIAALILAVVGIGGVLIYSIPTVPPDSFEEYLGEDEEDDA